MIFIHRLYLALTSVLCALALLGFSTVAAADEPRGGPAEFQHLKYRYIGPAAGGRVCRVAGIPGDPLVYYAATASAGVWKSSDGGARWKCVFDDDPSVGSVAVAPSDPNVLYIGGGEANIRGNVVTGHGIYKSVDAGKTWTHVWKQRGQVGKMIVHPTNPDIAFAAVLGHAFGPNPERGVYRTTDGGKSWHKVLSKDPDTGASDVCFDPSNPHILFAGLWQARRRPWELTSGGPGGGLYLSRDGGDTWKQLGGAGVKNEDLKGLPEGIYGKIGIEVAPSDGRRVYALIEAHNGGLFRSDDGGNTWKLASNYRHLRARAWYYTHLTVDPVNPNVVWAPNVQLLKSIDGGHTFQIVKGPHHVDHHDIWIDPRNPKRVLDGNDGGVDISLDGGETWAAPPLPITQFYHINVDNRSPYHISGTMQDLGSTAGPSNSLKAGGIGLGDWYPVGGGETGYTAHDPNDPNIVYAGEYGGYISRYDARTRLARNISIYPKYTLGHAAADMKYRFRWPAPLLLSADGKALYHAGNVLFKSTDRGQSWTAISPDLTRNDKSKQQWSGGPITGDNTTAEFYCTISALAESPRKKDLIWVGTDDGLVHLTRDGGKSWTNVTANISGLPEWATIKSIEASPFDAATAYIVVDAHLLDDMRPYLFMTTDFGKSWKSLTGSLPPDVYLHVVRADPKKRDLLFLGTERGVSFSTDGGASWQPLKLNLPNVPVHDLVVTANDLVVGTHGRSLWILDDLTPLRERTASLIQKDLHLFPPPAAVRWNYSSGRVDAPGDNPPRGAIIHYHLKQKPKGDITLEVQDAQGKTINVLTSKPEPEEPDDGTPRARKTVLPAVAGVQRIAWDLTYKGADKIKDARIRGDPTVGPTVLPGAYTLKLSVDGQSATAPLTVLPDPRLPVPAAELNEQLQYALSLRDEISKLTGVVEQLRKVRRQMQERNDLLKEDKKAETLVKQAQELIAKLDALEEKLHNPKALIGADLIGLKGGSKVYTRLIQLFGHVKYGDGAPTQGMREVGAELVQELRQYEGEWSKLIEELAQLNESAAKLDLPRVVVPKR